MAFVAFDPLVFLFWAFVSTFIPGMIISFSLFRKDEYLGFVEKALIGFGLGFILLPIPPFFLYLFAGVKFTHTVALLGIASLYLVAVALFIKNRVYEDIIAFRLPKISSNGFQLSKSNIVIVGLLIVLILGYLIRLSTYSPIFQELDPYYYTYMAHQILVFGENPFNDQTAWYPDLVISHRSIPMLSYVEAMWYSLYSGGGSYDNMLLALIASMYPPIAAVIAAFSMYLFVYVATGKRKWGLVAAGLTMFIPVLIMKLSAGEQEIQPYAFMGILFTYSMYTLMISKKDLKYAVLAGLGMFATSLGSASSIVLLIAISTFIIGQGILLFFRKENKEDLRFLAISNAVFFLLGLTLPHFIGDYFGSADPDLHIVSGIGALIFSLIMVFAAGYAFKTYFKKEESKIGIGTVLFVANITAIGLLANIGASLILFAAIALVSVLYFIKELFEDSTIRFNAFAAVIIIGLIVFAFTPIGEAIRENGRGIFGITQYNVALSRTIAEQREAGTEFSQQMGFFAATYDKVAATMILPISWFSPQIGGGISNTLATGLNWTLAIFSTLANLLLQLIISFFNFVLGANTPYSQKANSFLLFWIFAFFVAIIYSINRFMKNEDNVALLFVTILLFPLMVGIIKEKYTIYAGVFVAAAIAFTFSVAEAMIERYMKNEGTRKTVIAILLAFGLSAVFFQFIYQGFAVSLAWGSAQTLYQNDPSALKDKFQSFCTQSNFDAFICEVAKDPTGYANKGTNYQYDSRLCALSVYSNWSYLSNQGAAPMWEAQSAMYRCQRISPYWISAMEWIKDNTENDSRTISWWDYGHWINYFGQKNTVLRNEHSSMEMIGATADGYLNGTPESLKAYMKAHGAQYALFDIELVAGGGTLGGKYGALNYLSCAWNNQTTVAKSPGQSKCESEHLWEVIYIANTPCTISKITNKTGFVAYEIYEDIYERGPDGKSKYVETVYRPDYRGECINVKDPNLVEYCKIAVKPKPMYCVGDVTLANGQKVFGTYSLDQKYPNGDLKLNKARMEVYGGKITGAYHFGDAFMATLFYTNEPIWIENGEVKTGYEDRKGQFYDSNLYRGVFLESIPGFKLVYKTPEGAVRIYKIDE